MTIGFGASGSDTLDLSTLRCVFLCMPVEQAAVQHHLSDLLANVSASDQNTISRAPLIFGDFSGLTMDNGAPLSVEFLATQVKADKEKVNERLTHVVETLSSLRKDFAEVAASIAEMARSASGKAQGPTDPDGVAQASAIQLRGRKPSRTMVLLG